MIRMFAQIVACLSIAGMVFVLLSSWSDLPETVPIHFGASGKADGWGPKVVALVVPAIAVVIFAVFSFAERHPRRMNTPIEMTGDNARDLMALNVDLLIWMKALISLAFFYITWKTVQTATGMGEGLGSWFLPVFVIAVLAPVAIYVVVARRLSGPHGSDD